MTDTAAKKDIQKLQRAIVDALEDVKAQDLQVFDTEHLSPLFERVIIASGTSNRQTKALAASVRDKVRDAGFGKPRIEGEDNGEWIIVDCGSAVAHIMQPTIRTYYNLEEIWGDKPVRLKFGAPKPAAPEPKATARKSAAKKTAAKTTTSKTTASKTTAAKPAAKSKVALKAPAKSAKPASKTAAKAPAKSAAKTASKLAAKSAAAKAPAKNTSKPTVKTVGKPSPKAAAKTVATKTPARKAVKAPTRRKAD
ncbi:MAG: Ribosomal silencing factor RsfS [Pseudomonadota bacterium]|jgi:ribosome-associated protein